MKPDKIMVCLKPALALMLIAGIVTAALAGVNLLTKDAIETRTREAENAARMEVITADTFTEKSLTTETGTVTYHEAYQDDALVGYVFSTVTSGKSSGLAVMTGISAEGTITGIAITENSETAGYVDKVVKDGLLDRIQKNNSAEVDVTSNATRTSKGIMAGVKQAQSYYALITKEVTAP